MKPSGDVVEEGGSDNNANMGPPDQSRGAIPKTRPIRPKPVKKPLKINNNIEESSNVNCAAVSRSLNNCSINSESVLFEDGQDSSCASCGVNGDAQSTSKSFLGKANNGEIDKSPDDSKNDVEIENSDSSTEDDLLSISDDGCIYTYKGDQVADLPSSFFSIDIPLPPVEPEASINGRQQTASPEMDFLEMDFDPGPPDGDSECGDVPTEASQEPNQTEASQETEKSAQTSEKATKPHIEVPLTLTNDSAKIPSNKRESTQTVKNSCNASKNMPWACEINNRTTSGNNYRTTRYHSNKGDMISPSESNEKLRTLNFFEDKNRLRSPAMIWNEGEAFLRQITQLGPSACGLTAVLNVLKALRFPIQSIDSVKEHIKTRLRANYSPLREYLLSRSVAGTTHEDLIDGLHKISDGKIFARFFPMFPERVVNLESWLLYWITNGAVPIATLNLQKCEGNIPDAWHHQMIYGVADGDIYMLNPHENVEASKLWPQLCSESVLLIRREDVVSWFNYRRDLRELMEITDVRWREMNVVGQVANMIHEHRRELRPGFVNTSHIKIPAAYSSGITIACRADSALCPFLEQCPDLPMLNDSSIAAALPN